MIAAKMKNIMTGLLSAMSFSAFVKSLRTSCEAARTFVRNVARHLYDPAGGIVKELELGVLVEPETALTALREWDKVDREARQ